MHQPPFAAFTALIAFAAMGCAGFPSLQGGGQSTPLAAPKPGPLKQLATSVSESSFGKSVAKVFKPAKKTVSPDDPTALASGIAPTRPADYVAMGETYEQNGDMESARRMFHKALEIEPNHLGALVGLGRHFDRQGQVDRATEQFLLAARSYPNDPTAFNDLGLCYARQHRYDEAVQALAHAVELEPDRALYRNNIAMVLVAAGRSDEALAHLTDAHGPAKAHYNLGYLLDKQGHEQAALEQFKLALADDPGMDEARDWIEELSNQVEQHSGQAMIASIAPTEEEPEPLADDPATAPRERQNVAARPLPASGSPAQLESSNNLQPLPPVDEPPRRY